MSRSWVDRRGAHSLEASTHSFLRVFHEIVLHALLKTGATLWKMTLARDSVFLRSILSVLILRAVAHRLVEHDKAWVIGILNRVLSHQDTLIGMTSIDSHSSTSYLRCPTCIVVTDRCVQISIFPLIGTSLAMMVLQALTADVWCSLRHNRNIACLCTLITTRSSATCQTIGARQLLLMALALPNGRLFWTSGLTAGMASCPSLIVLHDWVVNHMSTAHQLALSTSTIRLIEQGDTVVHLNCSLRGWRHGITCILTFKKHPLQTLCLLDVVSV